MVTIGTNLIKRYKKKGFFSMNQNRDFFFSYEAFLVTSFAIEFSDWSIQHLIANRTLWYAIFAHFLALHFEEFSFQRTFTIRANLRWKRKKMSKPVNTKRKVYKTLAVNFVRPNIDVRISS